MAARVEEQFGRLVRVIKSVKRKSKGGGTRTVKQAFHVRRANPGDVYSAAKAADLKNDTGSAEVSKLLQKAAKARVPGEEGEEQSPEEAQGQEVVEPVMRMEIRYHDIAWKIGDSVKDRSERDPVPASVRRRFDKDNRAAHAPTPLNYDTPMSNVVPTDPVLWGVGEPGTIERMRTGSVTRMKLVDSENGMMLVRIQGRDHLAEHAYMCLESLRDPAVYTVWGDFYDIVKGDGDLTRRAAAAYETAKACGFDDLVPPTTFRFDDYGDFEVILPRDLIERREQYNEQIAIRTGENPDSLRKQLGGYAVLFLAHRDMWTVDKEDWFKLLFAPGKGRKDILNTIWDHIPERRRIAFLRIAMLDYILWIGDRNMGDITFCDEPRHPVHVMGNELSFACPRRIARAVLENGVGEFLSANPDPRAGVPMLWSDPFMKLATRGTERELDSFERVGVATASRMKDDRAVELARALIEHKITSLCTAGVLSRIWLLATHAKEIARNPYFVAQLYARVLSGEEMPEMEGLFIFVNRTMKHVLVREFDFVAEMRENEEDQEARDEE